MKNNMDKLLKKALAPMNAPDEKLNVQVLEEIKERTEMSGKRTHYRKRYPAAILLAAAILIMGSITAVAAYRYLSPVQVAEETGDDVLENAFSGEEAVFVNETQESGNYRITLLGSVAGRDISRYLSEDGNGIPQDDRIYTVVAIERADGTPMPDTSSDEYGKEAFYVSHYIGGLDPKIYSIMSMGGGYREFVKDGIQYRLMEMDNIEIFADKGIYVGVSSGTFYDAGAYLYDESTGKISRNEDYAGVNALFELPVDQSKADPAAAAAYLEEFNQEANASAEPWEMDETDLSVEAFVEKLTAENINEYAVPIESTRQICKPDQEGYINYAYELENRAGGSGMCSIDDTFPEKKAGACEIIGYSYSEGGLKDLLIEVLILNEDGTVTYVIYQPIE